jgi:hypothetical protein
MQRRVRRWLSDRCLSAIGVAPSGMVVGVDRSPVPWAAATAVALVGLVVVAVVESWPAPAG